MQSIFSVIIGILMGYFIGSIPFSYIVPKHLGHIDIRKHGSGNTGTTNVIRTLGLKVGLIAFVGDFLKGLAAATLGQMFWGTTGALVMGAAAVFGHCYSVWMGFKGGKGIATSAGAIAGTMPMLLLLLLAFQFTILALSRYMSLASVASALLFPLLTVLFLYPNPHIVFSVVLCVLTIYRHGENIRRLIAGTESKIFSKRP